MKTVLIQWPTIAQWDDFQLEYAEFLERLSVDFANLWLPDNLSDLYDDNFYKHWASLTASLCRVKVFRDKIKHIFFTYLEPYVEDMDPEASAEWISRNTTISAVFKMFVAIYSVDDWLKKKGQSLMIQHFQTVLPQSSYSMSARKLDGNGMKPSNDRYFSFDLSSSETRNMKPN